MRPVYLQGRGLISSLGGDLPSAVQALAAGGSKPRRVGLPGGSVWPCFSIEHLPDPDWCKRAERLICEAVEEAGVMPAQGGARGIPLFIASSSMDIGAIEMGAAQLGDGYRFAEKITSFLGWDGPSFIVSSACTSSLQALLTASRLIESGVVDDAVVLGVELPNRFSLSGFASMQLLSTVGPEPLGMGRDGITLGEAVAVLHLSNRAARWRICGGSNIVDGRDPTGALPETVTRMCQQALLDSGLVPSDIGLIKLQAAGSPLNDANELSGMADAFESMPPLVTLKSAIGHTLGASGAAEIALLTASLESGVWPQADYAFDPGLRYTLSQNLPAPPRYVLADILGFGGGHAAVILEDTGIR